MTIFSEAKPEMAFLKLGIYGEAGSGKTFTAAHVAHELHLYIKNKESVFFFDTETGSDFVRDRIEAKTGKKLMVAKTRAFSDLLTGMDEMPTGAILIIDSVTHYWNELIHAFMTKNNLTRLALKHWQPLKQTWREFTDRYVNSKLHIIVCGRSADKWDEVEDEDGSKELKKVGTKMRTETEMGYEPSLLVEMELTQSTARVGAILTHRAHVRKDRFDVINGRVFDNPTFADFLPHIERLNLGGEHKAIEPGRDSQGLFDNSNIGAKRMEEKERLLDEIRGHIQIMYGSQSEADKKARLHLLEVLCGAPSWNAVERKNNDELAAMLEVAKVERAKLEGKYVEPEKKETPSNNPAKEAAVGKQRKGAKA